MAMVVTAQIGIWLTRNTFMARDALVDLYLPAAVYTAGLFVEAFYPARNGLGLELKGWFYICSVILAGGFGVLLGLMVGLPDPDETSTYAMKGAGEPFQDIDLRENEDDTP